MLSSKIFEVKEDASLTTIAGKLRGYRVEEDYGGKEGSIKLVTEVLDLKGGEDSLNGIFSKDYVVSTYFRGGAREVPITRESPFLFKKRGGGMVLIVLEKKGRANYIANKLSEILFIKSGKILEARIPPEALRALHEKSPDATKVIFFDDVDIPNIDKLSLYGSALASTGLYSSYLEHGKIWYVVFEFKKHSVVMGVTRNCVVTMFSKVERGEFLKCIIDDILPLIR